jgi:putative flippase GtrA
MITVAADLAWQSLMNIDVTSSHWRATARQLIKYAVVGALSNLAGYCLYLLLTYLGCTPKLTMTALYSLGASLAFFANRRFTFHHHGHMGSASVRFIVAHALGYLLNLLLLLVFVDWLGFAHQLVQAVAIMVVAIFLFVIIRIFVFAQHPRGLE